MINIIIDVLVIVLRVISSWEIKLSNHQLMKQLKMKGGENHDNNNN